ncbi:rhomboid family intramembrane serine protease [Xanthovirga aplysinae]|uniref:rhomboid family intramembrane serine protease n=1 Tax=Xanthovirga aplysinae TaxID=2529853 RepID=UPI0012BCA234|nr:rhomboid family intramembrane serine protease [Xanthovirga aplysinae]MTI29591.1 rhomboid family intramembrane serine protease [Xanthovirga aplysinae]
MFRNLTPMVKTLLMINIGAFLAGEILPYDFQDIFGLPFYKADTFRPYQIFTHMFMHGSLGHLFGNMFALFMFGPMLERMWGSNKFLIFYMVTGLGASFLYSVVNTVEMYHLQEAVSAYMANPGPDAFGNLISKDLSFAYNSYYDFINSFYDNPDSHAAVQKSIELARGALYYKMGIPLVGASGAIFGILMAFGMLFPNLELMLLFFPVPIKAKYFVALYGIYELYAGILNQPGDNVAHFAHLGGMLFAYILLRMWRGNRYNSRY